MNAQFCSNSNEFETYLKLFSVTHYCGCLVTRGTIVCVIGDEECTFSSKEIHLLLAEGVRSISADENFQCYMLSGHSLLFPIGNPRRHQTVHKFWRLNKNEFKTLQRCFQVALHITHEEKLLALLQIMSALKFFYDDGLSAVTTNVTSRRIALFHHFSNLVIEHFDKQHSVKFYADKLCITPGYLTKVVRAISSITPKEFILRYVIHEAKALLIASDTTVEAVAEQLGFTDASAFSVMFKKYTGRSPKNFRLQNFKF